MVVMEKPLNRSAPSPKKSAGSAQIDYRRFYGVVLLLVAYVITLVPLYSHIGDVVFFLSLIPLVITASLIGTWPGIIVAVLLSSLNLYLAFALSGTWSGLVGKGVVFTLLHLLLGAGVGRWRDLYVRLRLELQDRTDMEARLEHLGYHDALTGLTNRIRFQERVDQEIAGSAKDHSRFIVLFLRLDRIHSINESLGHEAGDRLIVEASLRIQRNLRNTDVLARFGSDTFAALMPRVKEPKEIAPVIDKIFTGLNQPIFIGGKEVHVSARMGMAIFPQDGDNSQTILRNADAALSQTQEASTQFFHAYDPKITKQSVKRLALEMAFRKAVAEREFTLCYQPIVEITNGALVCFEVLLRWNNLELGEVSPDEIIPVADETGLIHELGAWILDTACRQLLVWQGMGYPELRIALNLSPRQLKHPGLYNEIVHISQSLGIQPGLVDFEITESGLVGLDPAVMENLKKLREAGFMLTLDDFGTGYSCLAHLKRLPLTGLKVDRTFIREVTTDPEFATITHAIVAIAKAMKLRVTAEGVESQEQCTFMWQLQCDYIQGTLFSHPLGADGVSTMLMGIAERRAHFQGTLQRSVPT